MNPARKTIARLGLIAVLITGAVMTSGLLGGSLEVVKVHKGSIVSTVEDTGEVRAINAADIYALQSGRIAAVPVKVGQKVTVGQVMVVMESLDLQIEKESARAEVLQANASANSVLQSMQATRIELEDVRSDLQKTAALHKQGIVSTSDYEKARLKVKSLQQTLAQQQASYNGYRSAAGSSSSMVAQMQQKANQLLQVSPVTGVVLYLPAKPQQVVSMGTLLARVGDPNQLDVKVDILEDDMKNVQMGQKVKITSSVLNKKYVEGTVTEIYPQAEEKASSLGVVQKRVPVIVTLQEKANLKPGYEVRVAIETNRQSDVIIIPQESVRTLENGHKQVTVIQSGRTRFREIETGASDKYNVEVVKGLKIGEVVVRDASQKLKEWQQVKPEYSTTLGNTY